MLKAEREHLENKVKTLTEKVKYLSTPVCEKQSIKEILKHFFKVATDDISVSGNRTVAIIAGQDHNPPATA